MKHPPNWTLSVKDAKRDFILQAAREEFMEKGLDGATMRGISLRAGCTTGAIYPLFDSKETIYAALLGQSLSRLDTHVAEAVVPTQPAAAQVEAACAAFLAYYLQHPFEVNLGLYAFSGLKRLGVGRSSDRALNDALWAVLERIARPLAVARTLPETRCAPGGAALQPDDRCTGAAAGRPPRRTGNQPCGPAAPAAGPAAARHARFPQYTPQTTHNQEPMTW